MRRCSQARSRRALVAFCVLTFTLAAAVPSARAAESGGAYADPLRELGAASPSCDFLLHSRERANCRRSGSAVHHYPLSSYGFDVRTGFSVTNPGEGFLGALQTLAAGVWMGLIYLVNGVLLLLEWAFALDLTGKAMPESSRTMQRLHDRAFGEPWLIAAIGIAGIWGIWRGLVQRRTTETFGGLAATVALMVLGLVIIARPDATVGHASRLANDAATAVLAAGTANDVGEPRAALASALAGVFDATVRDPWCALEFGSVKYCDRPAKRGARVTNADLWLAFPAQSKEREELHRLLKGEDAQGGPGIGDFLPSPAIGLLKHKLDGPELDGEIQDLVVKDRERARMQEGGGTFSRLALLTVITLGLLGAACLYGYLGVQLLLASVRTVLLLLFAPVMLLAPAFGDAGRELFLGWLKRLAGAIVAKLIYALFLTVTLAACATVMKLDLGWFGTWLMLTAFWWGIVVKRKELLGFASLGLPRGDGHGLGKAISQGYYGWQLGRAVKSGVGGVVERPARAVAAVRRERADAATARAAAVSGLATERLATDARHRLEAEQASAEASVGRRDRLRQELRATDRRLQGYDESVAAARAQGHERPAPTAEQAALVAYRDRIRSALQSPSLRHAEETVRHASRNRASGGSGVSERDIAAYRHARRDALARPPEDPINLRAAGVDPAEFAEASPPRRAELLGVVHEHLARERALTSAAEQSDGGGDRHVVDAAVRWMGDADVAARTAQERQRLRDERRQRRSRAGVYRRR